MSKRKRRLVTIAALLGVYLASYAVLSFCGGYRLVMFGRPNPPGLGLSDFVWQPRFGERHQWGSGYYMDSLGFFYFPLIYCDQKLVHPSRPYLTFADFDMDKPQWHDWPPIEQMHPTARRLIAAADRARERYQVELDAARKRKDLAEVSRIKKQMREETQRELRVRP
jgi:hypothetical protein